jgi:ABC-type nitrate/sulfonate/bicarbonate transport system permease component
MNQETRLKNKPWKNIRRIVSYLPATTLVLLLAMGIEWLVRTGTIKGFILPAPSAVLVSLWMNFSEMVPHLWETFWVSAVGFLCSILVAMGVAVLMDGIPWVKKTIYPLLVSSQTIPIMVITPVIILLLGYGLAPRFLVVILVCFFPIVISLYDGLQSVDPDMILLMKSMGAGGKDIFRHVKFPASMPSFFSGIRISATYCIMAAVIAEWQGSNTGLGIYMIRVKRSYDYEKMFAAILLIVLLSLLYFLSSHLSER